MTKDSKCRFIEEYANFLKAVIKSDYTVSKAMTELSHRKIDDTVRSARRGYITVDECMNILSTIRRGW